ncbi:MAG: TorF family putative porin [Gemmatimonadota bacterium]
MRRFLAFATMPALFLALVVTRPVSAQVGFGADLGVYSAYVWRGLSLTNRPVAEPDLWISMPVGANGSITLGGWSNIELGKYDDPAKHISQGGGVAGPDLTEFDPYLEYATTIGNASLSLGATGYIYPNHSGATSESNTTELYAQLGLGTVLSPSISAYYDIDKVKGLYLEGSISHDLAVSPSFTLTLGALAGLSAGQGCDVNSNDSCNFADNGFTHADFSVATSFGAGALSISPVFHFQLSGDDATKFNSPTKIDKSTKIWFGVSFSWASGSEEATETTE